MSVANSRAGTPKTGALSSSHDLHFGRQTSFSSGSRTLDHLQMSSFDHPGVGHMQNQMSTSPHLQNKTYHTFQGRTNQMPIFDGNNGNHAGYRANTLGGRGISDNDLFLFSHRQHMFVFIFPIVTVEVSVPVFLMKSRLWCLYYCDDLKASRAPHTPPKIFSTLHSSCFRKRRTRFRRLPSLPAADRLHVKRLLIIFAINSDPSKAMILTDRCRILGKALLF